MPSGPVIQKNPTHIAALQVILIMLIVIIIIYTFTVQLKTKEKKVKQSRQLGTTNSDSLRLNYELIHMENQIVGIWGNLSMSQVSKATPTGQQKMRGLVAQRENARNANISLTTERQVVT